MVDAPELGDPKILGHPLDPARIEQRHGRLLDDLRQAIAQRIRGHLRLGPKLTRRDEQRFGRSLDHASP